MATKQMFVQSVGTVGTLFVGALHVRSNVWTSDLTKIWKQRFVSEIRKGSPPEKKNQQNGNNDDNDNETSQASYDTKQHSTWR